jgi:ubiquinone/menaquinone biosynthesis C-methylase UbiE
MTSGANASQFEAWNGVGGLHWVATADARDRVLAPVADALLDAAAPTSGIRVVDIGCGCGVTTLMTATRVGTAGSAIGVDLSAPMLDVARRRARASGARNTTFVQGDAQTYAFEPGTADLVISRFGTMFFADPEAAFANVRRALRPRGRLCLATWQPLAANAWLTVPGAALLRHTDPPATDPNLPGMFAQSDPGIVSTTLTAAGFTDVAIEPVVVTFTFGQSVDDAVEYLADNGQARLLLETIPEGAARDAALADVHDALVEYHDEAGVRLGGSIWIVTATRPENER